MCERPPVAGKQNPGDLDKQEQSVMKQFDLGGYTIHKNL